MNTSDNRFLFGTGFVVFGLLALGFWLSNSSGRVPPDKASLRVVTGGLSKPPEFLYFGKNKDLMKSLESPDAIALYLSDGTAGTIENVRDMPDSTIKRRLAGLPLNGEVELLVEEGAKSVRVGGTRIWQVKHAGNEVLPFEQALAGGAQHSSEHWMLGAAFLVVGTVLVGWAKLRPISPR